MFNLTDFHFQKNIQLTSSMEKTIVDSGLVIFVVPSQVMRTVVQQLRFSQSRGSNLLCFKRH